MTTATLRKPARFTEADLKTSVTTFIEQLAGDVDAVRASETFQRWLMMTAAFHSYSLANVILILTHCPTATRVAGYRTWAKLGRTVRVGEKGAPILVPCWKKQTDTAAEASETGEGQAREHRETPLYFRVGYVFDVAQTAGDDLPTIAAFSTLQDPDLRERLMCFAGAHGIEVTERAQCDGAQGRSFGGRIELAPGASVKTLVHELAHELLHWTPAGEKVALPAGVIELQAESVAYVVCRHMGLTDGLHCPTYIAAWGGDAQTLRASLSRIQHAAFAIIEAIAAGEDEDAPF